MMADSAPLNDGSSIFDALAGFGGVCVGHTTVGFQFWRTVFKNAANFSSPFRPGLRLGETLAYSSFASNSTTYAFMTSIVALSL